MCKPTFYVGIDVGKDELWVAVPNLKSKMFKQSPASIKSMNDWVTKLADNAPIHYCMEATGVYGQKLAVCLTQFPNLQISIVNPAQIAAYAKAQLRRCKTDSIDAQVILAFAQSQKPPAWTPESLALRQLQALVSQAHDLKYTIQQWSNRQHSQSYLPDLSKTVAKSTNSIIRSLKDQLAKIEQAIKNLSSSDPYLNTQVQLLCSIPGIGEMTANKLLAYAHKSITEYKPKSLIAHAGLAPSKRQSGSSVNRKSHIVKQGDKRIRNALFMPALVAITYNPNIKQFYQRLLDNGKPKKLALVACMKKLLIIIRAILVNQKPFVCQITT